MLRAAGSENHIKLSTSPITLRNFLSLFFYLMPASRELTEREYN